MHHGAAIGAIYALGCEREDVRITNRFDGKQALLGQPLTFSNHKVVADVVANAVQELIEQEVIGLVACGLLKSQDDAQATVFLLELGEIEFIAHGYGLAVVQ